MVTKFTFDDLAQLCPGHDIERFRDDFDVLFDYGPVSSQTVGFHFSLDEEEPQRQANFEEMVKLFRPVALWAGSAKLLGQLESLNRSAIRVPYFEGGGFMVVLKIPFLNRREA